MYRTAGPEPVLSCLLLVFALLFKRNTLETSLSKMGKGVAAPGAGEKNCSLPFYSVLGKF